MKKIKYISVLLIGLVIGSIGVVIADYKLKAKDVEYEGKNGSTNVQQAITDLYDKATTHCPEGMNCLTDEEKNTLISSCADTEGKICLTAAEKTALENNCPSDSVCKIGSASGAKIVETTKDEEGNLVGKTYYAEVYLDPTDLRKECTSVESSASGTKKGCMKWYAYNEREVDGRQVYDLILDHNTTASVAWANEDDYVAAGGYSGGSSKYFNGYGPVTIVKELGRLTIETTNSGYGWKVIPRMITANEIAEITGAATALSWNSDSATTGNWFYLDGTGSKWQTKGTAGKYTWLYDSSYWTLNKVKDNRSYVWMVGSSGNLSISDSDTKIGLRPVITIYK